MGEAWQLEFGGLIMNRFCAQLICFCFCVGLGMEISVHLFSIETHSNQLFNVIKLILISIIVIIQIMSLIVGKNRTE